MLSKEEFIVLHHYLKEGLSQTAIASKLGINRRTVYRYLKSGKTEPRYGPRPPKPCLIDPFRDYIRSRLEVYPDLSAARLVKEIIPLGFKGEYSTVKKYVRGLRPDLPLQIERRFEVSPGHQAQADFATFKSAFGTVYAFLVVLSWSRYLWVRFYSHQDLLSALNGLHRSFVAFGGIPETVLFDRMKVAVARTNTDGRAIFNEEMLRFAHHYGFDPRACQPYRAKTKGRVERAVSYLRHNFFYGRNFRNLEDLNQQLEKWLGETANVRIHATTQETPSDRLKQELSHLKPLPQECYIPVITLGRKISHDGFVSYNGNDYSIPEGATRKEVEIQASQETLCLYQEGSLLAVHPVITGRRIRRLAPGHRRHLNISWRRPDSETGDSGEFIEVERRPLEIYEEVLR
jgi:transposase